ncbi:MAG: prolyl oligopeptidase family serine peptidase [Bacteroidota bacterium]|nr:prolyl oligopeptidase family serine peptidase [Bacteroidota bacterium]
MKLIFATAIVLGLLHQSFSQSTGYKLPPADVVKIVETPPTPFVGISPNKDAMMLVNYNPDPSIATLAQLYLKLGGIRVNPNLNSKQRLTEFTNITIQWFQENKNVIVALPDGVKPAGIPSWSPDGKMIAFGVDVKNGVELWVADTRSGKAKKIEGILINEVLMSPYSWLDDSERLIVRAIPKNRGDAPIENIVPTGPVIEETAGKQSKVMTFQDLLRDEDDELLFEYYGMSQPVLVNINTGEQKIFGAPALYSAMIWSPDESYLLVSKIRRPFSYRVPFNNFSKTTEIWDANGTSVKTLVDLPVTDEIPPQGVVTGPRSLTWQMHYPAKLIWSEAQDGGDPKRKVDFRDKIFTLNAPFSDAPKVVIMTQHRYSGFIWTATPDIALLTQYDRDRRWNTTFRVDFKNPNTLDTFVDLSVNDDYHDPGIALFDRLPGNDYVMAQDGDWAYYSNSGASPEGNFPRLDRINLRSGEKETLWESGKDSYSQFISFVGKGHDQWIIRRESNKDVPNFYLTGLHVKSEKQLTSFTDPAPHLTGIEKRIVRYNRPDGVPLSGTLMLPPGYKKGDKLPLFIWAYPLEYSDKNTAGQVRGSDNTFTFLRGDNPAFFLTQGYAVLMDATIPIVGDPETMNNTFIEQAVTSGKAAIDYLDSLGIIDRNRVGVGGHSYGAFMTANLLAHSDDYAYGIARSGAYNRTLTPFGFQSERRSFWEAQDIYMNVSPFTHADKINEPLLIIHGGDDNNPGTHTMQSERLFQAIKGNGGTARYVMLPNESHGYRAKESLLHVLAEMFEWADKYGKGKSARP